MDEPRLLQNKHGQLAIELRRTPGNVMAIVMCDGQVRNLKAIGIREFSKEYEREVEKDGMPYPIDVAAKRWLQADHQNYIKLSNKAKRELQMLIGIKEGFVVGRLENGQEANAKTTFPEGTKVFKSADDLKKLSLAVLVSIFNAAVTEEKDKVEKFTSKENAIAHVWAALEGTPLSEVVVAPPAVPKTVHAFKALKVVGDKAHGDSERSQVYNHLAKSGVVQTAAQIATAINLTETKVNSALNFLKLKNKVAVATAEEIAAGVVEPIEVEHKPTKEEKAAKKAQEAEAAATKKAQEKAAKEKKAADEKTAKEKKAADEAAQKAQEAAAGKVE